MFPALAGAFASPNPRTVLPAGGGSFIAAEPDGVYMARFAWANVETRQASSFPTSPDDLLGFVQPYPGYWRTLVRDGRIIRPGNGVTLFTGGDFYARFEAGAEFGARVYASTVDGAPLSGEHDDAEPTRWRVVAGCGPGGLAIISTWSNFQ